MPLQFNPRRVPSVYLPVTQGDHSGKHQAPLMYRLQLPQLDRHRHARSLGRRGDGSHLSYWRVCPDSTFAVSFGHMKSTEDSLPARQRSTRHPVW